MWGDGISSEFAGCEEAYAACASYEYGDEAGWERLEG
jgi:hypothetical protein